MAFTWHGERVKQRVQAASQEGINATLALCVIDAKQHHGGWITRTGAAEGSINIYQFARQEGNHTVGKWGSADVHYFIWLELRYFTLRASADRNYPKLRGLIQRAFARGA